jgi:hypothetical protein
MPTCTSASAMIAAASDILISLHLPTIIAACMHVHPVEAFTGDRRGLRAAPRSECFFGDRKKLGFAKP